MTASIRRFYTQDEFADELRESARADAMTRKVYQTVFVGI